MEFYFRAIMFFVREKETMKIKIGSNSQLLPIGSRFSRYSHSRTARERFSRVLEAHSVSEERQIKSVKKQQSKWLDIIWHCRLAIRIILSLALTIGTVSHINVLWYAKSNCSCAMQRGRCTLCIEDEQAPKRMSLHFYKELQYCAAIFLRVS